MLSDSVPKTHDIVSPSILVFLDKEHYVVILDVHVYSITEISRLGSFGEDDSPSFMEEDYFCESAITELSSSLAEFGKFVTVSLGV